jgi:hypothetical protein
MHPPLPTIAPTHRRVADVAAFLLALACIGGAQARAI